jgi:hypothetical protein
VAVDRLATEDALLVVSP